MAKETFERSKPTLSIPPKPAGNVGTIVPVTTAGVLTSFDVNHSFALDADFYICISASSPQKAGTTTPPNNRFKLTSSHPSAGKGAITDIVTPYNEKFGAVTLGDTLWVQVSLVSITTGKRYYIGKFSGVITGT